MCTAVELGVFAVECVRECSRVRDQEVSPLSTHTAVVLAFPCAQGGPGCASSFGLLYELGPWLVTEDLQLVANAGEPHAVSAWPLGVDSQEGAMGHGLPIITLSHFLTQTGSWSRRHGLLIIDQPVGTGLSFVSNSSAIPK